jgi:hypothetical protein
VLKIRLKDGQMRSSEKGDNDMKTNTLKQRVTLVTTLCIIAVFFGGCSNLGDHSGGGGDGLKITAGDAADIDSFGDAVALHGDYALVGAPDDDSIHLGRGAAYIFNRNQGGADNWGEVKKLTASDAENDDEFGGSVAIYDNYAVIGAGAESGDGVF